jgi:hypothetical protein
MKTNTQFLIPLTFLFAGVAQAAVAPTIKAVSVTPTNAPAGTMFKFTAELKAPLTTGNKVKIDLGKGLASMTGTKTSYSLSRAIYTTGAQTYKVGIYNAKNVLQGKVNAGTYTVTSASPVNHAPTLTLISADKTATANQKYTITLNAKDVDANLSSITMNWGDSTAPDTLTATDGKDLVFSHTYATASSFGWNAFATDKGSPALTSKLVSKIVTVSKPVEVVVKPVVLPKTTGYSKIANDGSLLPDDAKLGANPTDWACTQDNKTGLIWEVKTTDGGLRDMNKYYRNEFADTDRNKLYGTKRNADVFVIDVNSQGLCGASDWRLPKQDELLGIVKLGATNPSIDTTYFPNTQSDRYHSISPNYGRYFASFVSFYGGNSGDYVGDEHVRLVRFSSADVVAPVKKPVVVMPPPVPAIYTKIANDGSELPDSAILGTNPTDWACTKDNKTGLIWEVKTTDGGLRDSGNTYSWYEPDATKNGGYAGNQNGGACKGSNCDSYAFTNAVNAQGLCGATDWRMPSIDELNDLLTTTNTINHPLNEWLYIDATYFPNTNIYYWSSSPNYTGSGTSAWYVYFDYGVASLYRQGSNQNVRLVR